MATERYELIVRMPGVVEETDTVTLTELAELCECHVELIRRMVRFGLVDPITGWPEDPLFGGSAVLRLRRALRLKRDLRLNVDALALVMELLDRIDELEKR